MCSDTERGQCKIGRGGRKPRPGLASLKQVLMSIGDVPESAIKLAVTD